ncbi:hypothetical protein Gogos_020219 [Gossypium gossypioides]|uniref:Uncharacterized protein n=1 Tax=Gossypium gossypioides TaxID=34282 RepID=A0A7J9D5P8_GOSGO|nr:hypothetical protein [Gossypium gossypioides]
MESTMKISSSITFPINSTPKLHEYNKVLYWSAVSSGSYSISKISGIFSNGSASHGAESRAVGDAYGRRSRLESLFCYDKPIPEERIEEPVGVSLAEKIVADNPRCSACQAKGVVLDYMWTRYWRARVVEEPAMSCAQNAVAVVIEDPSNLWLAAFYM